MSGAPSKKLQSEKELKTTRALNTVATIGAGHALYSMTPEVKREAAREKLLKLTPEKTRPATRKLLATLKQPELGGKLTTAGKVVAGGWLGLHSAELVGDVMARRSINNQLAQAQAQKNKGSVGSVKKNDQSMISKAEGSVSRNGHGKAISDNEKRAAVAGGVVTGGIVGSTAGILDVDRKMKLKAASRSSENYQIPRMPDHLGRGEIETINREMYKNERKDAINRRNDAIRNKNNNKRAFDNIIEENKIKPSKHVRAKIASRKLSANRYAAAGTAIGAGAGGGLVYLQNKSDSVNKSYRRFDPEADRQRRLGLYAGTGVGGSIVAGREAARNFETKVVSGSGAKATTHRGLYAKPGKGKKGLGLAAIAAASGALGVGSYKRGISQRNQPWT